MACGTSAVTDNAFSYGTGGISRGNGSHRCAPKIPLYTKSINWSHYLNKLAKQIVFDSSQAVKIKVTQFGT